MISLPAGIASAEEPGGPNRAYFLYSDQCCQAVVARAVESGALVCIPRRGVNEQHFIDAQASGYAGALGPYIESTVRPYSGTGRVSRRFIEVIMFDLDASGYGHLSALPPQGFELGEITSFGLYRGAEDLPAAASIIELADNFLSSANGEARLDAYFTATEDIVPDGADAEPDAGEDPTQRLLQQLLSQAEVTQRAIKGMEGKVSQLSKLEKRLGLLEAGRTPAKASSSAAPLHPQLFDTSPGPVPPAARRKLSTLAGIGPGKLGDLHHAEAEAVATLSLGGIIEDEEADVDGEPLEPGEGGSGDSVLHKLLSSQTAILAKLASARSAQADPLNLLSAGSADSDETYKQSSGVRGIAARQLLADQFKKSPGRVTQAFRERLCLARRKSSVQDLEPRDLWFHFQESVPFGSHRTLTYMGFMAASMFEAAERNDLPRVQMLICLMAVFAEQAACDGGALRMAHLLTCLEDPPFAQTELHRTMRAELAHGQLSDPRWIATQLAYLRDLEQISDKSSKYVRGGGKPSETTDDAKETKPRPKFRGKKGKGQTQDAAADTEG